MPNQQPTQNQSSRNSRGKASISSHSNNKDSLSQSFKEFAKDLQNSHDNITFHKIAGVQIHEDQHQNCHHHDHHHHNQEILNYKSSNYGQTQRWIETTNNRHKIKEDQDENLQKKQKHQTSFSPPPLHIPPVFHMHNQSNLTQTSRQLLSNQQKLIIPQHPIDQQKVLHSSTILTQQQTFKIPSFQHSQQVLKPQKSLILSHENENRGHSSSSVNLLNIGNQQVKNPFIHPVPQNTYRYHQQMRPHSQKPMANTIQYRTFPTMSQNIRQVSSHSNSIDKGKVLTSNVSFSFNSTQNQNRERIHQVQRNPIPGPILSANRSESVLSANRAFFNPSKPEKKKIINISNREQKGQTVGQRHISILHKKLLNIIQHFHIIDEKGQKMGDLLGQQGEIGIQHKIMMVQMRQLRTKLSEYQQMSQQSYQTKKLTQSTNLLQTNTSDFNKSQQKCIEFEQKLTEFALEYQKLDSDYHKLHQEFSTLHADYQELQRLKIQLEEQNAKMVATGNNDGEVRRITELVREMQSEKSHLIEQLEIWERKSNNLERETKKLVNQLEIKNQQIQQQSKPNSTISDLQKVIAHQENFIRELKSKLQNDHLQISQYKQQIMVLQHQTDSNKRRQQDYQRAIKTLKAQNQELNSNYQRLFNQRNMLQQKFQQQISNLTHKLNHQQHQQHPSHYATPIIDNSQEMIEYQHIIQKLKSQLNERNQQKMSLEQSKLTLSENKNRMEMQKDSQIKQLSEKMYTIQKQLELQISDQERIIRNLQNKLQQSINTQPAIAQGLDPTVSSKINNLQNIVNSLEEQLSNKSQVLTKMQHQNRETQELREQLRRTNQNLRLKSQQLVEHKQWQLKYNQVNMELQLLKQQRNSNKKLIFQKDQQFQQLTVTIEGLEEKLKNQRANQRVENEVERIAETIKHKYRQQIQVKSTRIDEQEYQIEKLRKKVGLCEKNSRHLKQEYDEKVSYLEERIKQNQNRNKNYDNQRQDAIKALDVQICRYRDFIREKDNKIEMISSEMVNIKGKVSELETQLQQRQLQRQKAVKKWKDTENRYEQLKIQLQKQEKNRVKSQQYWIKINQLQSALAFKDKKIKSLESNLQNLHNHFSSNNQQDFIAQQQIETLKKRLIQYESKIAAYHKTNTLTLNTKEHRNMQVFEQKVIYNLKTENQQLRKQLDGKSHAQNLVMQPNISLSLRKNLYNFHQKLEKIKASNRCFEKNLELEGYQTTNRRHISFKNKSQEVLGLVEAHRKEISEIEELIGEWFRDFNSKQFNAVIQTKDKESGVNENKKKILDEELKYYEQKNKQLQQRVDFHLTLNRELKQKLQAYLNICSDPKLILFYKQQLQSTETNVHNLQQRIRKLTDKNILLQKQLQNMATNIHSQNQHQSSSDNWSLNQKIYELQGKIRELTQQYQRKCDENEKVQIQNKSMQLKMKQSERTIEELRSKLSFYHRRDSSKQVQCLRNQILRLEEQVERLKGIILEIQTQLQAHESFKNQLRYKLQYIRSIYIMIETILPQLKIKKEKLNQQKYAQILQHTAKGLEFCSEANTLI